MPIRFDVAQFPIPSGTGQRSFLHDNIAAAQRTAAWPHAITHVLRARDHSSLPRSGRATTTLTRPK
jgi:hypothetical protein